MASEGWRHAVRRLISRTRAPDRRVSCSPFVVAYRGDAQGFFADDSYIVLVDGQIDNLVELAAAFRPLAGTEQPNEAELIARLFAERGDEVFAQFIGSFALVIVVRDTNEVILARDRFGTRPLFYAAVSAGWAWASEIKCLCPLLGRVALDQEGLKQAIRYRYMVGETLIEGVVQVLPACFVRLAPEKQPVETQYWKFEFQLSAARHGLDFWADRMDSALDETFTRLRSKYCDIGILLSGGVDSSILALKASQGGFRTCVALTAKWPGENPELEWAAAVARHIGITHQILEFDESSLKDTFPWLIWRMEEPPRHYNSFVLARLFEAASTSVQALLNGHAADALFGPQASIDIDTFRRRQAQLRVIPQSLRMALSERLPARASLRITRLKRYLQLDEHEFAKTFFRINYGGLGKSIFGRHFDSANLHSRALERFYDPRDAAQERFQRFDLYTFNQSHLTVFDRLSAPLGIPVELPFLSPEIVELASQLPSRFKADGDMAKPVLKVLAARYFPRDWIYRKKQGFPTQTSRWLGGLLSHWTSMLTDERTSSRDIVDLPTLHAAQVGRDDEAIWTAMSLEVFCRQFIDGDGGPESAVALR